MEHVRFVVSNTYLSNNTEMIILQTTGIPMGTNTALALALANLTLYTDEAKFIDDLIIKGDVDSNQPNATNTLTVTLTMF
jgi:hypothetical protein